MKWIAVTLVFVLLAACEVQAARVYQGAGLFSNLYQHDMTGDFLGVELYIAKTPKGYVGALLICEGGCSPLYLVSPVYEGNKVRFDFMYGETPTMFEGTADPGGITGGFHFPHGEPPKLQRLERKKTYWNEPIVSRNPPFIPK